MKRYDDDYGSLLVLKYIQATAQIPTLKRCDSIHEGIDDNWLLNDFIALRLKHWKHPDRQRGNKPSRKNGEIDANANWAKKVKATRLASK